MMEIFLLGRDISARVTTNDSDNSLTSEDMRNRISTRISYLCNVCGGEGFIFPPLMKNTTRLSILVKFGAEAAS